MNGSKTLISRVVGAATLVASVVVLSHAGTAVAATDPTNVTGTAGNAQVSLSWTAPADLTFPFSFNGTSYSSVFIGSNTYMTFGSGSSNYSGLSAANPNIPGVHLCAADNSFQQVFYKVDKVSNPNRLMIRYEGNGSTSGTVGAPGIIYEATYYANQSYFDVLIGIHNRCTAGTRLATNGSTAIASPAFAANTNWRVDGATVTQNGQAAAWVGSSSATMTSATATSLGYTQLISSSYDDFYTQAPAAPTGYAIQYSTDGGVTWTQYTSNTNSTAVTATVTGLTNGTNYVFRVANVINGTVGAYSAASASVTPQGTPGAPTAITPSAGSGQATVSWTAPASNGGSAITGYSVQYSTNSGSTWTSATTNTGTTATSYTVTGLTNGTSHIFKVAAVNANGTGTYSANSSAVTPYTVPGAPTSVTGTRGAGQVSLSWTAPASNGGSAVTDYAVQYSSDSGVNWTTFTDGVSTATTATVTGLTNGTAYVFRTAAVNAAGTGSYSTASAAVTPSTTAGAPTSVAGTGGNTQVALTWTAPVSNGGGAITGYSIQYSLDSGATWTAAILTGSTATSYTVTGLTNGISYLFKVASVNAAGTGTYSANSSAVTPYTTPAGATGLAGTRGDAQVALTWTAGANNGSAITGWSVQYSSNSGSTWSTTISTGVSSTGYTVTGLTNGTAYVFRVAAVNAAGTGTWTPASAAVTPMAAPGAPTSVSGARGNTQVTLAWSAPAVNGGSAITDYGVQYSSDSGSTWTTFTDGVSTSTSATVTGLTNGTSYLFRVNAANVVGSGSWSTASSAVIPYTVPDAPTSAAGTPGDTQITVTWTAPASNGGNAISDYTVEYSTNSGTTWIPFAHTASTATTATVTGLTNGTGYIFRVTAINAAGSGTASASSSAIIPRTTPSAVQTLAGTSGNAQMSLTWAAPASTGGSAITDYTVQFSSDLGNTWSTFADGVSTTRSATVTGLTNGTGYTFRVAAVNAAGTGAWSLVTNAITPFTTPGTPTGAAGTRGNTQVDLTWSAPSSTGGNAISDYTVQYSSDSGVNWTTFTHTASSTTSITVTGLTNGTAYLFRVAAVNAAGAGSFSTASSAVTPITVAGAPTTVAGTAANAQVALTWSAPASNGGNAISDYTVQYSSDNGSTWASFAHTASSSASITVTGLSNGTSYVFRTAAVNAAGTGAWSTASAAVVPRTVADAPTGVTATPGNTQISITWTAPSSTGGAAITDYVVNWSSDNGSTWTLFADGVSTNRAATVTGLTNGTSYVFRVAATNVAGTGAWSSSSTASAPRTVAGAPTISSITTGNASLSVNFTAGATGGSAITTYQYSTDGGATWRDRTLGSTASPLVITTLSSDGTTSLANGTTYSVTIRAVNDAGNGSASATVTATPLTLATVPTGLSATPGDQSVVLSWTAPSSNGGAAISNYVIEYSSNAGSTWTTFAHTASSSTSITVTGLANGTAYVFRAAAVNSVGTGPTSVATSSVTPRATPSAPGSVTATAGNGTLTVTWTAPADGGSAITDYVVEYSTNSGSTWTVYTDGASTDTNASLVGLTNGTAYSVRVAALNAAGTGSYGTTASTTTPRTVPDAPTLGLATPSNAGASIAFTMNSNGGAAVSTLQYTVNNGTSWANASSTSSPLSLTGLTNGTTYSVRIRAVNVAGSGAQSNLVSVTPRTVPAAPTVSSVTPGDSTATVTFTAGSDGGSSVTNYEYTLDNGVTWLSTGSVASPLTISALTNGTSYSVRIRAVNIAGNGAQSGATSVTPYGLPGAPTISSVTGGIAQVSVALTAGTTGGSTITNYEYSVDNGATWTTRSPAAVTSPMTISGLSNGTRYDIRIKAVNAAGSGPASSSVSSTTKNSPAAPTIVSTTASHSTIDATVSAGANGGDPISNYQYSVDNGATWTTRTPASPSTQLHITGLTDGTDYQLRVRAVNTIGPGDASSAVTVRPHTTPAAPTINTQIAPGNQTLTITFSAGASGGETVTSYEYSTDRGITWTPRSDGGGTTSPIIVTADSSDGITSLANGTTYDVQIRAVNSLGTGDASNDVSGTPKTVPDAPSLSAAVPGHLSAALAFSPGGNGGAAITGYEYSTDGGVTWASMGTRVSPFTITALSTDGTTPLANGTTYDVKIRAVNSQGQGQASSTLQVTPRTTPGVPSLGAISTGDRSISIAFTEGGNGGNAISGYEYSTDGGVTWRTRTAGFSMTSSPITITKLSSDGLTSLVNGTSYDVQIRAVNDAGHGQETTTVSGIPTSVPGAPTITSITAGDGRLTVNFSAGSPNGRAILSNEISVDGGNSWITVAGASSPVIVTGLTNGTTYTVLLHHVNANGSGDDSSPALATPITHPDSPVITSVTESDRSVTVGYSAPADGGSAITTYQYSTDGGLTWRNRAFGTVETSMDITTLSSDGVTRLTNGTAYQLRIRAVNAAGDGDASENTRIVPYTVAAAPVISSIGAGDASADIVYSVSSDGGSPVTSIDYSVDGGSTWVTTNSTTNPLRIGNLTNGHTYSVIIRATNRAGSGTASNTRSVTPSGAPTAPGIFMMTAGNGTLLVSYTPAGANGSVVTGYQQSIDGGTTWATATAGPNANTILITGLTNGSVYPVRIRALNANGNGIASEIVTSKPYTVPTAPRNVTATQADNTISVVYTAPVSDGGESIIAYEYSIDNGNSWVSTSSPSTTTIVIGNLSSNSTYTVLLRALTAAGSGATVQVQSLAAALPAPVTPAPVVPVVPAAPVVVPVTTPVTVPPKSSTVVKVAPAAEEKPVVIPETPALPPNYTFARVGSEKVEANLSFTPESVELTVGTIIATIGVTNADGSVAEVDPVQGVVVEPGSRITITLKGYKPGDLVDVILHSRPIKLGQVRIGRNGIGRGTFLVPAGVENGHHTVQMVQVANPENQTVLALGVTSRPEPAVTPTTTTTVPATDTSTGTDNGGVGTTLLAAVVAFLVIAAGAWFVISRRKRDDVDPS